MGEYICSMTDALQINHQPNAEGGRYWAAVNGGDAELTYQRSIDKIIIIDHTYVPPAARGGSIARELVERAVADARAAGVKIVPQCPYVDKLFNRRPDLNETRAK